MYSHKKRRLITFIATLVAYTGAARAQTRVTGAVVDSVSHQNMEGASVHLVTIHGKDTVPVAGTIAKSGGRFNFSHVDAGAYHLSVSFQGYQPLWRAITVGDEPEHLTLCMYPAAYELAGLLITDTRPVRMHGDTTAYKADQFHTAPNAAVGDLLRKMPGVNLSSGAVIAQGDTVKRILVNGKRFFSNDMQIALKYLPRDVVATIEIFDDKSDQAKFTGVDDGIRIRTINIVLKKNIKSGIFGQASLEAGAAVGDNSTPGVMYKTDASLNHFRGENMSSLVGSADNTMPTPGGTANYSAVGINHSDHWGKSTQFSGSYRMQGFGQDIANSIYTQNLLPGDSTINSRSRTTSNNHSTTHAVDVNLETDPFKNDHMTVHGTAAILDARSSSSSQTASVQGSTIPLNNSIVTSADRMHNVQGNISAVWGHRFAKTGRSASIEASFQNTNGSGNGINKYDNTYFKTAGPDSSSRVYQSYSTPDDHLAGSLHATYEEPIFKKSSIMLEYSLSTDQRTNGRSTYDLDSLSGNIDHVDSALTNRFKVSYQYQQGGAKFHFGNQHLQITTGFGLQDGHFRSADLTNDTTLRYRYTLFYPMTSINLTPKKGMHLDFMYQGYADVPPIRDLQPVVNNTNPLNIVVGNPGLRQSFAHMVTARINSFDALSSQNLTVELQGQLLDNSVVTITHVNVATGVDTSTFSNLNGNYNWRILMDYGLRLKKPASNLSFGGMLIGRRSIGYINETLNRSNEYNLRGSLRWSSNLPDHIDMNVTYEPDYTIATFSAEPSQNTHYFTHSVSMDGKYYTTSGWQVGTNFSYNTCSGRPVGFNPTSALWNMTLSKLVFKHKAGEIRLSVYNLLDQVDQVNATISATQIRNSTATMLGRYMLLGFIYHLSPEKQP